MTRYDYTRTFLNPPDNPKPLTAEEGKRGGDRPGMTGYQFDEEIVLAVNVARAANRPLLVAGKPGTGKSSLASAIAAALGVGPPFVEVITERTEARDLKWRFDALGRLRDATIGVAGDALAASHYIVPGVLWRAFDESRAGNRVVVLIDEIDKADPDVPNGLLVALGAGYFDVDELKAKDGTPKRVWADAEEPPFIVITTNDERELPSAFVRRCITLTLCPPSNTRLVEIARAWGLAGDDRAEFLANKIAGPNGESRLPGGRSPNAAEYLDALRAWRDLGYERGSDAWDAAVRLTLIKHLGDQDATGGS